MEKNYNPGPVYLFACFILIAGFGSLILSYSIYSSTDFGYPDIDDIKVKQTEEITRLLNIIGAVAIVLGSLIFIMTGLDILSKQNQELEQKIDYILNQMEIEDNKLRTWNLEIYEWTPTP